ncbi:MAG: double-strand break repair helicase AddA [Shimia sp.]
MTNDASRAQTRASRPDASTWLAANAGSGKTRVLTDRVARLLLAGVEPSNVLCLTYTKAAAGEMQNRLFKTLGGWAMTRDGKLAEALADLGVPGPFDAARLSRARTLFARAIETPGGLKIQTIHAFCAGILRRFPLEAGVSPDFAEMDDRTAAQLRAEVVEEMARASGPEGDAVDALARVTNDVDFDAIGKDVVNAAEGFAPPRDRDALGAMLGLPPGYTQARLIDDLLAPGDAAMGRRVMAAFAGESARAKGGQLVTTFRQAQLDAPSVRSLLALNRLLDKDLASKGDGLLKAADWAAIETDAEALRALADRVAAKPHHAAALQTLERTHALHVFAAAFLPRYEARKQAGGHLSFDDLIARTGALLGRSEDAQWVLYRLDGGIDHILVDEAQDTAPAQWRIVDLLAREIVSGEGARGGRTVFVVGDKKQSIYSFQGADPAMFDTMRDRFAAWLPDLQEATLRHSFRSAPEILRVVDHTFADREEQGLGQRSDHAAFFADLPGRVELWPPIVEEGKPPKPKLTDPVDAVGSSSVHRTLAEAIADRIEELLREGRVTEREAPSATHPQGRSYPRPVRPGDLLILVQRRKVLYAELHRALKARRLPVAGADRLRVNEDLAVRDVVALLSFLATPEDDLSLAAALRSPLFGWSEGALFRLAHGRGDRFLWAALRDAAEASGDTVARLTALRDAADFLRPYELIETILTRHDGRQRLVARLGAEVEEALDALLALALAYEPTGVPSLTGFLGWLAADDPEIKREVEGKADGGGGLIRLMTVHGAKGLEAPIVILPETDIRKPPRMPTIVPFDGVAWRMPARDELPPHLTGAHTDTAARMVQERQRLLYVAMTRAEQHLIVAAAGNVGKTPEACWYAQIAAGMEAAGAWSEGDRVVLQSDAFPTPEPHAAPVHGPGTGPTIRHVVPAPPAPPPQPPTFAPSDLGGAKTLPGTGEDPDALDRGTAIHALLEHLPDLAPADRAAAAAALAPDHPGALAEAQAVIAAHPTLFRPDALCEVAISAPFAGGRLHGTIDRLLIDADRVLAVDFKSNVEVPKDAAEVPEGVLRQLGAYAVALAQLHPGARIETAILWTADATLMPVPPEVAAAALRRAGLG